MYLQLFKVSIAEFFIYRLNFILWRLRVFINFLVVRYFLWLALFNNQVVIFGYTKSQMFTYIMISAFVSSFVLSSRTEDLAGEILQGKIINYILRPVSIFKYFATRDFADKAMNTAFSIVEIAIFIALFHPPLYIPLSVVNGIMALLFFASAICIGFFINMSLSFIGFWSNEVWGPRFIFLVIVGFLAGNFFPLDILPPALYKGLLLTPFPYLYFLPTRVLLGLPFKESAPLLMISCLWAVGSYYMATALWAKGMKQFSFFGR